MPDETSNPPAMPERIAKRFEAITAEVQKAIDEANLKIVTTIPQKIAFSYESAVLDRDILSEYERAQSVSFVTRFDHFPDDLHTRIVVDDQSAGGLQIYGISGKP